MADGDADRADFTVKDVAPADLPEAPEAEHMEKEEAEK